MEGASKDLTRNNWDYAQSTSGYLAKLDHQPTLDDAVKEMNDSVRQNDHKNDTLERSEIAREVNELKERRLPAWCGAFSEASKRIMTLSFLDKLFSPTFNVVNSLQPEFPTLAGRYGVGRSFDAMGRAYRDISGLSIIGKAHHWEDEGLPV